MGKPTGLAAMEVATESGGLRLTSVARLSGDNAILGWIDQIAGDGPCVCAVDAPLVIPNATGIRLGERELNAVYRKYHAGCHPGNLGRPFAAYVTGFSCALEARGFVHGPGAAGAPRQQIEVHPHAASVSLFGLDRIVKYKKGLRADRARELERLRGLIMSRLGIEQGLELIPVVPSTGDLKVAEDQIDAVTCAVIAHSWWRWGEGDRNIVFGNATDGYVVVPRA